MKGVSEWPSARFFLGWCELVLRLDRSWLSVCVLREHTLISTWLYKETTGNFLEWAADWEGTGKHTGWREDRTEKMDMMWAARKRRKREGARQHPRPCSPTPLPPLWPVLLFCRLNPLCPAIMCHSSSKSKAFSYFNVPSWYHPTPQFQLPAIKDDSHSGCHLLSTMFSTKMSLGHHSPHTRYTFFPPHLVFLHRQHHHPPICHANPKPGVMITPTSSFSPMSMHHEALLYARYISNLAFLSQYHPRPNNQHLLPGPSQLPTPKLGSSNQTSTKPEGLLPLLPSLSPTSL